MERYICIHSHFYQPPRENPWLEAVEATDSAYPYHDWNERITAECYAPNTASRILDGEGRIVQITNNYSKISFNFGPTLLSWLEEKEPDIYQAILDADRESRERFSGHGSALAQVYNHMILPLANRRDRETQVRWGLRDFEHRFGRLPEGMWLSETAVDLETLEILAEHGIRFTLLAPHQARRVKKLGARAWRDVSEGKVDPTRPYLQKLPSGRSIALFFYDGPISRAVAFEGLLRRGEHLVQRLLEGFSQDGRDGPQLVHIATDGETYGHHHRHGDMALASALDHIESNQHARLTNYAEYLEKNPPADHVEIYERTSWSCVHGVDRWWRDCGCNSGKCNDWRQRWRQPLREAFDWLRETLAPIYEEKAQALLRDPWAARDDYLDVVLNGPAESLQRFLGKHATHDLNDSEIVDALKLLEMQRHALLMYTSCGWFFDDVSGIEAVQVIQYAGRTVQLAGDFTDRQLEAEFVERLARAPSNIPEHRNGAQIYETFVKTTRLDLPKVGAHYAISSLFGAYDKETRIYCFRVETEDYQSLRSGKTQLVVGRARFTSEVTRETGLFSFGVLHFGDHNLSAGIRKYEGPESYDNLLREASEAFGRAETPETLRLLDRHFHGTAFSLKSLFRDEQRKVVSQILAGTLADAENSYRQIYDNHAPLMHFLGELGMPPPQVLHRAAEVVLNGNLRRAFTREDLDFDRIQSLLDAARREGVALDGPGLGYELKQTVERLMEKLRERTNDASLLLLLVKATGLIRALPFPVELWKVQNIYYEMLHTAAAEYRARTDEEARHWIEHFDSLGEELSVQVPRT